MRNKLQTTDKDIQLSELALPNRQSSAHNQQISVTKRTIVAIGIFLLVILLLVVKIIDLQRQLISAGFKLADKQQKISELSNQVNAVRKNSQDTVSILNKQIAIKRKNQNMFRNMSSTTYIQFPQNQHYYDPILMKLLTQYYASKATKSIADFGCGKCEYIINLLQQGYDAKGYDGTPFSNQSIVKQMDLSQKTQLDRKFDYVQSFQVGQHIYSDLEDNFIYNIVTHARKGIILSWSLIGQPGFMHVNNRQNRYIIQKIEKYSFKFNEQQTKQFRSKLISHFGGTIMVFDNINI